MSTDFSAYAIIGISIDKDYFYEEPEKIKAYDHNYVWEDGDYCPITGKKLWKTFKDLIPQWDGEDQLGPYKVHRTTNGYDYIVSLVAADDTKVRNLGKMTASNYGNGIDFVTLPDNLTKLKKDLKNYLEPLGMWDESNFGLYSVLYCSY